MSPLSTLVSGNKSLCVAMGSAPVIETEYKDYKRQIGYGYKALLKVGKPQFKGSGFYETDYKSKSG